MKYPTLVRLKHGDCDVCDVLELWTACGDAIPNPVGRVLSSDVVLAVGLEPQPGNNIRETVLILPNGVMGTIWEGLLEEVIIE